MQEEERALDLATSREAARRRLWTSVTAGSALLIGLQVDLVSVSPARALSTLGGAIGLSWIFSARSIHGKGQPPRLWLRYLLAALDTLPISGMVFLFNAPVLAVGYFLTILPNSFARDRWLGYVTTAAALIGFVAASFAHALAVPGLADWPLTLLTVIVLAAVSQQVIRLPAGLMRRLRRMRECLARVDGGERHIRADARGDDELGFLERRFNYLLDERALLIESVQQEAEQLADVASRVHDAASALQRRSGDAASGAQQLSEGLTRQRELAADGLLVGQQALATAEATRETADLTAKDANHVDATASQSREAIERAAQTLVRVSTDVGSSAERVQRLAPASERVGDFVATVSRIARQTNLLALNAAIEASRAGDEGLGFAVVADEIRKLAGESAQAAKLIASTVQRVREDIGEAVRSMDTTSREVTNAGSIAHEATSALSAMVNGITRFAEQSGAVAALAQTQVSLAAGAVTAFDTLDSSAKQSARNAQRAADTSTAQRECIEELSRSASQLSQAAARMRATAMPHSAAASVVLPARPSAPATAFETTVIESPATHSIAA